jgi:hypothetical protein
MSNEYETAFYRSVVEPISSDIYIVHYFKRSSTAEPFAPDKDDVRHIGGLKPFENKKYAHRSAYNYSRRRG